MDWPWTSRGTHLFFKTSEEQRWWFMARTSIDFDLTDVPVHVPADEHKLVFIAASCKLTIALPTDLPLLAIKAGDHLSILHAQCMDPSIFREDNVIVDILVLDVKTRKIDKVVDYEPEDKVLFGEVVISCNVRIKMDG